MSGDLGTGPEGGHLSGSLQSGPQNPFAGSPSPTAALAGPAGVPAMSAEPGPHAGAADQGRGPFSPGLNRMLTSCFGHMLDNITVARGQGKENRGIAAEAHTIDRHISLGDHISEDTKDGRSMEIIAHEVSHALARGGSGKHVLNQKDDPGETLAYDAGRQFRRFVESGGHGPAPSLRPAVGGQAAVHRYEAGEHADAVDNASELLQKENAAGRTHTTVDKQVQATMKARIQLKNGLWVSPGEITAMMGDFYGAFDKQGKFDPEQAFKAMNEADPKEMGIILKAIQKEKDSVKDVLDKKKDKDGNDLEFKATDPGELENLTKYRNLKTAMVTEAELDPKTHKPVIDPATGKEKMVTKEVTSGYSMLELADRNRSHFSTKDESGADNNMGAYASFHEMAMAAAKRGENDLARAYEASAMHFLTDRFAGGHQFDKDKVLDAAKETKNGVEVLGTGVVRIEHNKYNKEGVEVSNGKDKWDALGDEHWADEKNAPNRRHTAEAVYASYSELQDVIDQKKTPEQVSKDGYAARKQTPQFSDATEKRIENEARNTSWEKLTTEVGPEVVKTAKPFLQRKIINMFGPAGALYVKAQDTEAWLENAAIEGAIKVGKGLGKAGSWLTKTLDEAGQGIKRVGGEAMNFAKETAGQTVDGVKEAGGKALDWAGNTAGQVWDGAKNAGGKAVDFVQNTAGDVASGTKNALGGAWNWLTNTAGGVVDHVVNSPGSTFDYLKEKAGEATSGISSTASKAYDYTTDKIGQAGTGIKNVAGQAYDFTADKLNQAGTGIKNAAGQAYNFTADKISQAGTGIKNAAGQATDFVADKAGQAWGGIRHAAGSGVRWLGEKGNDAIDGVQLGAHQLANYTKEYASQKVQDVKDLGHGIANTAGHAWNSTTSALGSGWNYLRKKTGL